MRCIVRGSNMKDLMGRNIHGFLSKILPPVRCLDEMNYSDLLEREAVPLQSADARDILRKQVIVVTGAAGSIGSELCQQLLDFAPDRLIALDTNETGLFDLAENLRSHDHFACFYPYIGDIKDIQRMARFFAEVHP